MRLTGPARHNPGQSSHGARPARGTGRGLPGPGARAVLATTCTRGQASVDILDVLRGHFRAPGQAEARRFQYRNGYQVLLR